MSAEEKQSSQNATTLPERNRRGASRKIVRILAALFVMIVTGLAIVLYNPVRTVVLVNSAYSEIRG